MNELYNMLPEDLIFIIEDYSKDRTNYDKVMAEFEYIIFSRIEEHFEDERYFCAEPGHFYQSDCISCDSFREMKEEYPRCYDMHIECLDDAVLNGKLFYLNNLQQYSKIVSKNVIWNQ